MAAVQVLPFGDSEVTFEVTIHPAVMYRNYNSLVLCRRMGRDIGMNMIRVLGCTRLERIDVCRPYHGRDPHMTLKAYRDDGHKYATIKVWRRLRWASTIRTARFYRRRIFTWTAHPFVDAVQLWSYDG